MFNGSWRRRQVVAVRSDCDELVSELWIRPATNCDDISRWSFYRAVEEPNPGGYSGADRTGRQPSYILAHQPICGGPTNEYLPCVTGSSMFSTVLIAV